MLKFSSGNRKLCGISEISEFTKKEIFAFDLPAGYTCPAADICQSFANRIDGHITDGVNCKFRCYSASTETYSSSTRRLRWHNFDLLFGKSTEEMYNLILESIPNKAKVIRIHASGDFFHKNYFMAWVRVAIERPDIIFFGYTKILNYVRYEKSDNFHLVYSMGGKMDKLHTNEVYSRVVGSEDEATALGLPIACKAHHSDDFWYIIWGISFALLVHGTQPKDKVKYNALEACKI